MIICQTSKVIWHYGVGRGKDTGVWEGDTLNGRTVSLDLIDEFLE